MLKFTIAGVIALHSTFNRVRQKRRIGFQIASWYCFTLTARRVLPQSCQGIVRNQAMAIGFRTPISDKSAILLVNINKELLNLNHLRFNVYVLMCMKLHVLI